MPARCVLARDWLFGDLSFGLKSGGLTPGPPFPPLRTGQRVDNSLAAQESGVSG